MEKIEVEVDILEEFLTNAAKGFGSIFDDTAIENLRKYSHLFVQLPIEEQIKILEETSNGLFFYRTFTDREVYLNDEIIKCFFRTLLHTNNTFRNCPTIKGLRKTISAYLIKNAEEGKYIDDDLLVLLVDRDSTEDEFALAFKTYGNQEAIEDTIVTLIKNYETLGYKSYYKFHQLFRALETDDRRCNFLLKIIKDVKYANKYYSYFSFSENLDFLTERFQNIYIELGEESIKYLSSYHSDRIEEKICESTISNYLNLYGFTYELAYLRVQTLKKYSTVKKQIKEILEKMNNSDVLECLRSFKRHAPYESRVQWLVKLLSSEKRLYIELQGL